MEKDREAKEEEKEEKCETEDHEEDRDEQAEKEEKRRNKTQGKPAKPKSARRFPYGGPPRDRGASDRVSHLNPRTKVKRKITIEEKENGAATRPKTITQKGMGECTRQDKTINKHRKSSKCRAATQQLIPSSTIPTLKWRNPFLRFVCKLILLE